jgi:hypothetical protein
MIIKFNTSMPIKLRPYYNQELSKYQNYLEHNELGLAWRHLERAHVIGQSYPLEHSYTHWKMLQFGFMIKNTKEILGQIPRLLIGGIKSFVGKVPLGNTGGSNVSPLKSMPIEEDLAEILEN